VGGTRPCPALPAHSMSAAAEIRTDPSGSRREGRSPRSISALTQGTVRPSQRAASDRVSAARPSIRITGPTVPATSREVQDLCTSICMSRRAVPPAAPGRRGRGGRTASWWCGGGGVVDVRAHRAGVHTGHDRRWVDHGGDLGIGCCVSRPAMCLSIGRTSTAAVTRSGGDDNDAAPRGSRSRYDPLTSGYPLLAKPLHVSDKPCPGRIWRS